MDVRVGLWRRLSTEELMLLNCGVGEHFWESLGLQGDPTSPFWRRSALEFLWKEWCLSWNSSTLATSCEELTHWKRLWCWEGLEAGGEGDDRGWDGWMASLTRWTWVWVNSRSCWWTGRPGVLWFMGSQRVGHDWATELKWTELKDAHVFISGTYDYINFHSKRNTEDMIKLRVMRPEDFPELSKWAWCNYNGLWKRESRGLKSEKELWWGDQKLEQQTWKMEEGVMIQGLWVASKRWKR